MQIFPDWWQRHFLFYEGVLVFALGALEVVYGYRWGGNDWIHDVLSDNRGAVYGALITVFSSLFGFIIAATAIIVGVSNSPRLTLVRESGSWRDLWKTLFSTIRWLGVATLFALIALAFDSQDSPNFWIVHVVLILTILVVVRLWRSVWVLEEVIKLLARRSKGGTASAQADDGAQVESSSAK